MTNLENAIKDKLGIRWVEAKKLLEKAKERCEIDSPEVPVDRENEVLEEACELFGDIPKSEQDEMKQSESDDLKNKLMQQAQRREVEWREKEAAAASNEQVREKLRSEGVPEEEVGATRVTAVRKIEEPASGKGTVRIRRHTCLCVIQ